MKKAYVDVSTGLLFGLVLYFLGAIDFYQPISYIVIFSLAIIIVLPLYKIVKLSIRMLYKNNN